MVMNKPSRPIGRPLRDLLGKVVGDAFTRQGFASAELVTRWREIAGVEIAAVSEPIKISMAARVSVPSRPGKRGLRMGAARRNAGAARRRPSGYRDTASHPGDLRARQSLPRLARDRANRVTSGAAAPDRTEVTTKTGCRRCGTPRCEPPGDRRRRAAASGCAARRRGQSPVNAATECE